MYITLLFLITAHSILVVYLAWQVWVAKVRAHRLNKICAEIYKEYKKTHSPKWAEQALSDVIKRVVTQKDSTTIYRA